MTNTRDVILQLKEVREAKQLSYSDIINLLPEQDKVSVTTLSRVFRDGSEDEFFSYEKTIRPLALALLDIETVEETDDPAIRAFKEIIKLKHDKILELEKQNTALEAELNKQKVKAHDKLEKEREQFKNSLDFLREQLNLKDGRMDKLLDRVGRLLTTIEQKDSRIESLTSELLSMRDLKDAYQHCPYRNGGEENGTN